MRGGWLDDGPEAEADMGLVASAGSEANPPALAEFAAVSAPGPHGMRAEALAPTRTPHYAGEPDAA